MLCLNFQIIYNIASVTVCYSYKIAIFYKNKGEIYKMRINKLNREEYHEQHFLIHNELNTAFKTIIGSYNNYGLDKTNKSEIIRMLITNFMLEYLSFDIENTQKNNFELHKALKEFRKRGAGTKGALLYETNRFKRQ